MDILSAFPRQIMIAQGRDTKPWRTRGDCDGSTGGEGRRGCPAVDRSTRASLITSLRLYRVPRNVVAELLKAPAAIIFTRNSLIRRMVRSRRDDVSFTLSSTLSSAFEIFRVSKASLFGGSRDLAGRLTRPPLFISGDL
jgi:hypothetical protein